MKKIFTLTLILIMICICNLCFAAIDENAIYEYINSYQSHTNVNSDMISKNSDVSHYYEFLSDLSISNNFIISCMGMSDSHSPKGIQLCLWLSDGNFYYVGEKRYFGSDSFAKGYKIDFRDNNAFVRKYGEEYPNENFQVINSYASGIKAWSLNGIYENSSINKLANIANVNSQPYSGDINFIASDLVIFQDVSEVYNELSNFEHTPILLNWKEYTGYLYIKLQKYDLNDNFVSEIYIAEGGRPESGFSRINLSKFMTYSRIYKYNLIAMNEDGEILSSSNDFRFIYGGSDLEGGSDMTTEESTKNIIEKILSLPGMILDGIKNFFIPGEDFFSKYFTELNNWFSDKLGILYYPFEFIINFLTKIKDSNFGEPVIEIPDLYIPLFEENGPILKATTFNFNEFIGQNEKLMYIYNTYLICADGLIIFGLIRLISKKYEEVFNNGS